MNFTTTSRTGYIGMERDSELGLAEHGVRKYDDAIGRFTSPDALWEKYVGWSPYQYSLNNPVMFQDGNGYFVFANVGERVPEFNQKVNVNYSTEYKKTIHVINQMNSFLDANPKIMNSLMKYSGNSKEQIKKDFSPDNGPKIFFEGTSGNAFTHGQNMILSDGRASDIEKMNNSTEDWAKTSFYTIISAVLHEYIHTAENKKGINVGEKNTKAFEKEVFGSSDPNKIIDFLESNEVEMNIDLGESDDEDKK